MPSDQPPLDTLSELASALGEGQQTYSNGRYGDMRVNPGWASQIAGMGSVAPPVNTGVYDEHQRLINLQQRSERALLRTYMGGAQEVVEPVFTGTVVNSNVVEAARRTISATPAERLAALKEIVNKRTEDLGIKEIPRSRKITL